MLDSPDATDIVITKTVYSDMDDNKAHTDKELTERWFLWLQANTDYDQLIMEHSNGYDYWILVAFKCNGANKQQVILNLVKHPNGQRNFSTVHYFIESNRLKL